MSKAGNRSSRRGPTGSVGPGTAHRASGAEASPGRSRADLDRRPGRPGWLSPRTIIAGIGSLAVIGIVAIAVVAALTTPPAVRNITVADLRAEMAHKDFTLLNVKTPYIGEIEGTDLYIPYDQLQARAAELPADHTAKLVVYCRTGNESSIAVQTLATMGYTRIENVLGGMQAWTAAGGTLVRKSR